MVFSLFCLTADMDRKKKVKVVRRAPLAEPVPSPTPPLVGNDISPLTPPTNTPAPVPEVMEPNSPSLFTRINTPSDDGEEDEGKSEEEDEGGDDEQSDVVSPSPFQLTDEMQKGRNKVIASEIKKLDDVDECAEILSLLTLHFRYLKKEICGCGVRLTIKYKELGACAKCSVPKNPVKKILCMNCKSPSKANS